MHVRYLTAALLAAILLACPSLSARAAVIHFDDITSDSGAFIPLNYAGFTWDSNWAVYRDAEYMSDFDNTYGSPSGDYAAYNGFGVVTVTTSDTTDFDFNGAYVTGFAENDSQALHTSRSITMEGWDDGVLIASVTTNLPTNGYVWLTADFASVDQVRFINDGQSERWWLLDNFTYNEPLQTAVPEPTSIAAWLLGAGAFGLVLRRRMKKSAA